MDEAFIEKTQNIDEETYKEDVKAAVENVVNYRMSLDIDQKPASMSKSEFISLKASIYLDAIKRGEEVVISNLSANSTIENPHKKHYSYKSFNGDGITYFYFDTNSTNSDQDKSSNINPHSHPRLSWRIEPSTEDIFAQSEFYTAMENSGLEDHGVGDLWTSRDLIHEMYKEGVKVQQKLFNLFNGEYNKIAELLRITNTPQTAIPQEGQTVKYLTSTHEYLQTIILAKIRFDKKVKESGLSPLDLFAEEYLIPSNPLLHEIEENLDLVNQITKIHGIFTSGIINFGNQNKRSFEPYRNKEEYERTLLIKIIKGTQNTSDIRFPSVKLDTLVKVGSKLIALQSRYRVEEIINVLVYENNDLLNKLFIELGINNNLGFQYFINLIGYRIKEINTIDNLTQTSLEIKDLLNIFPSFKTKFILSDYATYEQLIEEEEKFQKENAIDETNVRFIVSDFYNNGDFINGKFNFTQFSELSYKSRIEVYSGILNNQEMRSKGKVDEVLQRLLELHNLRYDHLTHNFGTSKFVNNLPESKYKRVLESFDYLLEQCISLINSDDESMLKYLDEKVLKGIACRYIRAKTFDREDPRYRNFPYVQTGIKGYMNRDAFLRYKGRGYEEFISEISLMSAGYIIFMYYSQDLERRKEKLTFEKLKMQVLDQIREYEEFYSQKAIVFRDSNFDKVIKRDIDFNNLSDVIDFRIEEVLTDIRKSIYGKNLRKKEVILKKLITLKEDKDNDLEKKL